MNFVKKNIIDHNLQNTIRRKINFSGVGVHNGRAVSMSIEPAEVNTGIIFERTDVKNNNKIKADIANVVESSLCTKIQNDNGITVSTIEHLMATFNAFGIDNAIVKINSSELPALDGSSSEYVKKIVNTGLKVQHQMKKVFKIVRKVKVKNGDRFISITPSDELTINITINYPKTIIGQSQYFYKHSKDNFIKNLSMARTYTLFEDIEKMRIAGLAIGGNLNNAIVVDKHKILNPDGLRIEKEFVKHKTLDCIGDFYLLGMPLIGTVNCFAPGHNLNQLLIKEILKNKDNYIIKDIFTEKQSNNYFNLVDKSDSPQKITCVA